jgi:hypothetical protein
MTYRVIQWATGGVGRHAVAAIVRHPELELVGCWVHSPSKVGRDVGELVGGAPLGVSATDDVDALVEMDADAVMYAPLLPDEAVVARLLRAGKNVVTPLGWVYPDPARSGELTRACAEGVATLHGSGIHPGGITERFPLMLSSLSSAVTHVRAEEFSDMRTYAAPEVVREVMGFGGAPERALAGPIAAMLGGGYKSSVRMVCHAMGFADTKIHTVHEVAVATAPIDSPVGVIEPGQVAAQRFRWEARPTGGPAQGRTVVTAAVNWLMGEEHLDQPWSLEPGGPRFEIEIEGDPPMLVTFAGLHPHGAGAPDGHNPALAATANHCVNAIPYVCRAEPGIQTYLDLPLMAGRAGI